MPKEELACLPRLVRSQTSTTRHACDAATSVVRLACAPPKLSRTGVKRCRPTRRRRNHKALAHWSNRCKPRLHSRVGFGRRPGTTPSRRKTTSDDALRKTAVSRFVQPAMLATSSIVAGLQPWNETTVWQFHPSEGRCDAV